MISDLARTAENLDSALTRGEMSPPGRRREHHANVARDYLTRINAAALRRIHLLDPPATPRGRDGGAPAGPTTHAPTVPAPGAREKAREADR